MEPFPSPVETSARVRSVLSADERSCAGGQPGAHLKQEKDRQILPGLLSIFSSLYFWPDYPPGESQVWKHLNFQLITIIFFQTDL